MSRKSWYWVVLAFVLVVAVGASLWFSAPARLSNISVANVTNTSVDIYWTTQEPSDSQVDYWSALHMFLELDQEMVINHHLHLSDLTPATTYRYKVMSRDRADNLAVSDEHTLTTLGTPATFVVSALDVTPAEVDIGEKVTISVVVANTDDARGTHEVTLKIEEAVVAIEELTLAGGFSQTVTFTIAEDTAGTHTVSVDGLAGTFEVKAAPPAPPQPINWWLIGGIAASFLALLVFIGLTLSRRRA